MAEEKEIKVEEVKKEDKKDKKADKLKAELEKLQAEVNHWKNEYYRAYADTQNLRKSLAKDHQEAMKYRAEGFIDELLPVLDSFHIVLSNEPEDPNLKNYLIGFQFIYKNLVAALENEGVSELSPNVGDKFDASTMNAVELQESDGEEGVILKVVTKGYKLHDRLIRPVNVIVSGHPKKEEDDKPKEENNAQKFDA